MLYFDSVRFFAVSCVLALASVPAQAETLYSRLDCEAVDGEAHIWIHSKIFPFETGKPAVQNVQSADPQEMADQIWANLGEDKKNSEAVIAKHAEPFHRVLSEKYGLRCINNAVSAAAPKKTVTELEAFLKIPDTIWINLRKQFDNIDLKIRVIAYPQE